MVPAGPAAQFYFGVSGLVDGPHIANLSFGLGLAALA